MAQRQPGTATISVDLPASLSVSGGPRKVEAAVLTRLLELLDLYEVAALLAIAEPADAETVRQIRAAEIRHEIGLLGDATWLGEAVGRGVFARELARRMADARDAGLAIRTLVTPTPVPRSHYDLLIKHGIAAVRQPRLPASRAFDDLQPQLLRHGIWEAPATAVLPRPGAWWGHGAGAARNSVRRAVAGGVAHVAFDLAALASADRRLQSVESVLRSLARGVGRGALRAVTLGALAEEWSRTQPTAAARSILRAA